jgi:hypothetical protein
VFFFFADIKQRVRKEVFEGREARGWHRQGAELAAAAVLSFAVASYVLYARYTGWLAGLVLGELLRWALYLGFLSTCLKLKI